MTSWVNHKKKKKKILVFPIQEKRGIFYFFSRNRKFLFRV